MEIKRKLQHQCLRNYIGSSAFADVGYFRADIEANFFLYKKYSTPVKMLLLVDVDEYNFTNAVTQTNGRSESGRHFSIDYQHHFGTLLAKHAKLIFLCIHAKKLINNVIMVFFWVNFQVWTLPSCNPVVRAAWPRIGSWYWSWTWVRKPFRPPPVDLFTLKYDSIGTAWYIWAFIGPRRNFGLILLILNMIIIKEFYRSCSFFEQQRSEDW